MVEKVVKAVEWEPGVWAAVCCGNKNSNEWVSELDLCIISYNMLKYMNDLRVIYENDLPSDHAPLL